MNKISNLFAKHWRNFHFITVIILVIVLIVGKTSVVPYVEQTVLTVFYAPFDYLKQTVVSLHEVSEENERLNYSLTEISVKLSFYEEVLKENNRLRSTLGFDPAPDYKLLPAKVISIGGEYIPLSAVINKGSDDSIFVDQPVINQNGLIGRISKLANDYATVQLLTDPSNRVAARVASSREMGIIKYTASEGMILDNFPIQGEIIVGDTILSSGLGGIYPAGIVVGIVKEVVREELAPFCDIKLEPTANFFSIDELFILEEEAK